MPCCGNLSRGSFVALSSTKPLGTGVVELQKLDKEVVEENFKEEKRRRNSYVNLGSQK